jgi:cytoskeletal protein RodZ
MKKKRKPKKRTGTSTLGIHFVLLPALLLAGFLAPRAAAKKKPALDTYAIVSGSVFQESGYALPGADVSLVPEEQSDKASKPMTAVTDARGEFVFHVPPGPAHYAVTVDARGYQRQRKSVSVQDQERVEVTFQMENQSK